MDINDFSQKPLANRTYAKNEVPPFVISTNSTLLAILSIGNEIIYKGIYAPDFNGKIYIDFRGLYDDYLKTIIPTTGNGEITHTEYIRQFTATFEVAVGEDTPGDNNSVSWYVANAKLRSDMDFSDWSLKNFLTNQPIEKATNYESPEWLTWIDQWGMSTLTARFYPKVGGSKDVTVFTASNIYGLVCYSVNVRYSRIIRMANLLPNQLKGFYDLILYDAKTQKCADSDTSTRNAPGSRNTIVS